MNQFFSQNSGNDVIQFKQSHVLIFILSLAFLFRFVGVWFGLPFNYHADEALEIHQTLGYGTGDFNPHFFKLPPLVTYLLFPFFALLYGVGHLTGAFSNSGAFLEYFLMDPTVFYLIARILFGVLAGVVGVLLLYFLCKRFLGIQTAVIASFWLAVNFLHIRNSHYYYLDIPLIALLIGSMYFILKILHEGSVKDYLLGGFCIGAAIAMKYNGVFLIVPFLVAHCISGSKQGLFKGVLFNRSLFISLILIPITFFLLNPFALLDWNFFIQEGLEQLGMEPSSGWAHHFLYSLNNGMGWTLISFSILGLFLSIFLKDKSMIIINIWIVVYYAVLARSSQPHDRYVLPLIPFMIVSGAWALNLVFNRLRLSSKFLFFLVIFILSLPNISKAIVSDYLFVQDDTRTQSYQYVQEHIPKHARIALAEPYFYSPRLERSQSQWRKLIDEAGSTSSIKLKRYEKLMQISGDGGYDLFFLNEESDNRGSYISTRPQISYEPIDLRRLGIQYVIVPRLRQIQDSRFERFLKNEAELLVRFSPYRDSGLSSAMDPHIRTAATGTWEELLARETNGEIVEIYQVK